MIIKGDRKSGVPIIIENGAVKKLNRISLNEKTFNEAWLQKLIYEHANLLPVDKIEDGFSPLIPLGREMSTSAGYIDNLYISETGNITIVETKLWRNAESRREVIGQVIDYAKELSKWTFADLDKSVIASNKLYQNSTDNLFTTFKKYNQLLEAEEHLLIDNINKNLKRGKFLLLIVGDGIQDNLEEMVDYLHQTPQLHFTIALVELQVYSADEKQDSFVVIPQLVTRTREITRAIVRIENGDASNIVVTIPKEEPKKQSGQISARATITAEDFFEQLKKNTNKSIVEFASQIIKDAEDAGYLIEWNSGSFGVKLPDPIGTPINIGLFNVDRNGLMYLAFSRGQFEKLNLSLELSHSFAADTLPLFPGLKQSENKPHIWNKYPKLESLQPVYEKFTERLKLYVSQIKEARMKSSEE